MGGGFRCRDPSRDQLGSMVALFLLPHFFTFMLLHPPHEAGKSLCVAFEACIHASEGAKAPHDHVELIEIFLKIK
jgi:hypothetical protein